MPMILTRPRFSTLGFNFMLSTYHAITDVTGFGLIGHLTEMALGARKNICIDADRVPISPSAIPLSESALDKPLQQVEFNRSAAITIGVVIGGFAGIIGQGGAFLNIPALLYVLHVPTRITIGSSIEIGIASSAAVLLGRIGTDQVPWVRARILGIVITASAVKIWWELV
jgi:uncharacterized membrane protein YfcA